MFFLEHLPKLTEAIAALAEIYRFYLVPLDCDRRLRERIESALASYLYAQPEMIGEFQDKGINYRPRWESEEPIRVQVRCRDMLLGVPESLWV